MLFVTRNEKQDAYTTSEVSKTLNTLLEINLMYIITNVKKYMKCVYVYVRACIQIKTVVLKRYCQGALFFMISNLTISVFEGLFCD